MFISISLLVLETGGIEELAEFIEEYAPVIAPVALIATVAPAPLPMFPPQGVPQPATTLSGGSVSGGGFTPAAALGVRSLIIFISLQTFSNPL